MVSGEEELKRLSCNFIVYLSPLDKEPNQCLKKDEYVKVNFIDQKTARQKTNNGWLELQLKSNVWSLKNSLNEQKKTFDLTLIIFKHFVCTHYVKAKKEHTYNLSNSIHMQFASLCNHNLKLILFLN